MPFVFSHVEYCDMHFVYGFCDGNARAAVEEYMRKFVSLPRSKSTTSGTRRPCSTYGFVPLGKSTSGTVKRNFIH